MTRRRLTALFFALTSLTVACASSDDDAAATAQSEADLTLFGNNCKTEAPDVYKRCGEMADYASEYECIRGDADAYVCESKCGKVSYFYGNCGQNGEGSRPVCRFGVLGHRWTCSDPRE